MKYQKLLLSVLVSTAAFVVAAAQPLELHPENPHYFLFRGKPTVLVTSGEHYGAVVNLDFDFKKYLDTLAKDGLNNTRTWGGAYCESPEAFGIARNTLAPHQRRFLCPWARSDQPGYVNGGNKFDLTKWDKGYFKRLKEFVAYASNRGIIVEMNLFCPFYEESMWRLSPMNSINNVNAVGSVARTNVYTMDKNGGLLAVQEAMVRKLVNELSGFDNLYYEICNEPYFGGVTLVWQRHIADVISASEGKLKYRHLISQNIANDKAKVENPHPEVSIFNFHYATPPDTVAMNYELNKVIGDNETGFRGTNDVAYRTEGWDFIVAGGGLYNNLDYSFVAGQEDGTFVYPANQPGGGSPALRKQLGFLSRTVHSLDFVRMRPDSKAVQAQLPERATVRALVKPGEQYLVYLRTALGGNKEGKCKTRFSNGELEMQLSLPPGTYSLEWLDPAQSVCVHEAVFTHTGGVYSLTAPAFEDDLALVVRKK